ncbi:hypothetical protein, variant 1 [Aphanomyces invadans]|uniref:Kinesin motor domain-containing protein n=2 Tax=Aphanomyces invadans TaxID=157072 RepID=A0A024TQG0_9STRA|nr:hypothetical protein, variant 1 [Aphanomyces invadans]ETV96263.1 hypothetical protein, variant 1 [Aphanomyces invadans]|eukprot:XP_008875055.1 hypothetical protein, variant 1 [Aphanomyces invadans]
MVPEKQWRDKGDMMDKRTARKVHGLDFRTVITQLRRQWTHHHTKNQDVDGTPESSNPSGIQVYIRKRPMLPHEPKKKEYDVVTCAGSDTIIVHDCQMYADMKRKFIENHVHKFSKCFGETASTDDVFDEVGKPLVDHAIAGGKSVIMMYGQTGSGKTHTMSGLHDNIADMLFRNNGGGDSVVVTAVEIAGTKCMDLLRRRQKVLVCDDEAGNSRLLNVTEREATSAPALLAIIHEALDMRATEATSVNAVSSRSHFLCSISIQDTAKPGASRSKPSATTPCRPPGVLTLLDLAGSERNEDSFHHSADRRRETIEINSSHLALKQCVRALGAEDPTAVVPYRHSILTRLLKESLWANGSRAAVIATVSPIATDTEHTLHTLQYAAMMLSDDNGPVRKERVEVASAVEEAKAKAIKDWAPDDVVKWWSGLKKGLYAKYTGNIKAIDGKQLLRLALPRLIQLCNNNSIDGEAVFKSLQKEKAADDKSDKERRARNIAVRKNK